VLQRVRNIFQSEAAEPSRPVHATRAGATATAPAASGVLRHSNGLREFLKGWDKVEGRRVLDLGCTSAANLNYFTGLGHGIHNDDLLHESLDPRFQLQGETGPVFDVARWLDHNLDFGAERFEAILLWDLADYMPEPLIKPLIARITHVLKPGGTILAYFHTKDAGPDAPFLRYHIHDVETLQLRPGPAFRLLRVFNNRHVENLFQGYRSVKFFLARDNLREVVATK